MLELIDIRPDVGVQESEYRRLLGYPVHHVLEGRSRELADSARAWYTAHGRPWIYARQTDGLELAGGQLRIGGTGFVSKQLHDQFAAARADAAMLVAVSAGRECEEKARELWEEGKPDEYFFMEMYGSAVVEHLITTVGGRICAWADGNGLAVLPHYSPGYSGWDVSDQIKLWQLILRNGTGTIPGVIDVLDTGMLRPKKSLLALFGMTRQLDRVRNFRNLVPCENCSLPACQYRRAPYQNSLPQIEDVRRLQSDVAGDSGANIIHVSMLNHSAEYSVHIRALRKWSKERLQLKILPDRTLQACFRYEGTTCVNLGRPLEFDYHLRLSPREEGYRVMDATCLPAPGDTGHKAMCEYLNNAELLMTNIAKEKPLLGRPLNDIFTWQRQFSPSGCYCDAGSRAHKWGLALEVIHYALVQQEKEMSNAGGGSAFNHIRNQP